ncbi:UDP-N-acetylmuramoyl-L-alanyl-D-glutamate--2,6-diaminopimelate ligase [Desulfonauticus submarinus]
MVSWPEIINLAKNGKRVVADSRKVKKGDIFVAIPGVRIDGSVFALEALEKGASYIVSKNKKVLKRVGNKGIYHPNPSLALGELAKAYYFPRGQKLRLIGITGTNGKTTVCFFLEHLLKKAGFKVGIIGTVLVRWPGQEQKSFMTTPDCLTLYQLLAEMEKSGVEIVCMEVSSHALSQDRIAGLEFEIGVFTNLTQDHLDYHNDMQDYFKAKSKLFQQYAKKAVLYGDCKWGKEILTQFSGEKLSYGFHHSNDFKVLDYKLFPEKIEATFQLRDKNIALELPFIGKYNLLNVLAAMGVGEFLGILKENIYAFESCPSPPGRMELVNNEQGLGVIIDYAHTPDALENVCKSLKELPINKLVVVFGCGGDRDKIKRPLMAKAVSRWADFAIVTTDNPRCEAPEEIIKDIIKGFSSEFKYLVEMDRKIAISKGLNMLGQQDILLIAGKGHEDYQEICGVKYPFSDKEVVFKILEENNN